MLNSFQGQAGISEQLVRIIQQIIKMLNALKESEVKALKKAGKKEIKQDDDDDDEDSDYEDEDSEEESDEEIHNNDEEEGEPTMDM